MLNVPRPVTSSLYLFKSSWCFFNILFPFGQTEEATMVLLSGFRIFWWTFDHVPSHVVQLHCRNNSTLCYLWFTITIMINNRVRERIPACFLCRVSFTNRDVWIHNVPIRAQESWISVTKLCQYWDLMMRQAYNTAEWSPFTHTHTQRNPSPRQRQTFSHGPDDVLLWQCRASESFHTAVQKRSRLASLPLHLDNL